MLVQVACSFDEAGEPPLDLQPEEIVEQTVCDTTASNTGPVLHEQALQGEVVRH